MVKALLEEAGHKVGVIGTIEVVIGEKHIPVNNTTPESYDIHSYFRQMAEEDCDVVVMEASSQGFKLDRTAGILFDYGLRTFLQIISDRMNIRILRNIFLARQSCFNSVNMDMRILMMSILQRLRRMPLARSRHLA